MLLSGIIVERAQNKQGHDRHGCHLLAFSTDTTSMIKTHTAKTCVYTPLYNSRRKTRLTNWLRRPRDGASALAPSAPMLLPGIMVEQTQNEQGHKRYA